MSVVSEVREDNSDLEAHSRDVVREKIAGLKLRPYGVLYLGGVDCQMTMEYIQHLGYFVSASGNGEPEEWLAVDETLPTDLIDVDISGQQERLPRKLLVPDETVFGVAEFFYSTGDRSRNYSWMKSVDFYNIEA